MKRVGWAGKRYNKTLSVAQLQKCQQIINKASNARVKGEQMPWWIREYEK